MSDRECNKWCQALQDAIGNLGDEFSGSKSKAKRSQNSIARKRSEDDKDNAVTRRSLVLSLALLCWLKLNFVTRESVEVTLIYLAFLGLFVFAESYSSALPSVLVWLVRVIDFVFLPYFTSASYSKWKDDWALCPYRGDSKCPSHYRRPDAAPETGGMVRARWNTPTTSEESLGAGDLKKYGSDANKIKVKIVVGSSSGHYYKPPLLPARKGPRAPRRGSALTELDKSFKFKLFDKTFQHIPHLSLDSTILAKNPHMDHLPLSFMDFLWCQFFVVPPAVLHFLIGGAKTVGLFGILRNRVLHRLGLVKRPGPHAASRMVADMMLEIASLSVWCEGVDEDKKATFRIPNAGRIASHESIVSADLLVVINLKKRLMIEATHGEGVGATNLGSHDALALVFLAFAGNAHPVIHSYANWGCNTSPSLHWFVRRMSVITIKYNYIGVEFYPVVMQFFQSIGFTTYTTKNATRLTCYFNHNVPTHKHGTCRGMALLKLKPYSESIAFILRVRSFFLSTFDHHKESFPGIDGEALFIGTVMHALDHRNGGYLLDNRVFLCDRKDDDFVADHDWACITQACAVDRPPGRLFRCGFENAPHPFYGEVYAFAKTIDKRLADYMEACIAM